MATETSNKIIFQKVRCSYVFIDKPRKKENGDNGNYSLQVLLPKNDPQVKKLQRIVDNVLKAKFGEAALKKKARYKLPLRDGDEERDTEEYEGMFFLNANSGRRPGIVNKANEPADADDLEEYGYSGANFHVSCNVYAFDAKDGGKPGVAIGLNNVMLHSKGERLDGTTSATSDFSDFAEEGGSDMDDFDEDDI